MSTYFQMNREQLEEERFSLQKRYEELKALHLSLDMTRGKPCPDQLDIGSDMLGAILPDDVKSREGFDCRNYGLPFGLEEAKELFAEILHIQSDRVIVGNNSSLSMMHDTLMRSLVFGEIESEQPWMMENNRKWLCPVPGYDRHFLITQKFGFAMIPVPMTEEGPDMDVVEKLVAEDSNIKGMWCLPLYSNPDGYVYSEKVCLRLASMKTAARDFRVLWDNAYVVHHLYADKRGSIPDILSMADRFGYPNRFYEFASTSKISFAGSGIACIASNPDNIQRMKTLMAIQSIGPDKINQIRHVKYLKNCKNIENIMEKQAAVILPKFVKTESILAKEFADTGIAKWNSPIGGYFISLFVMNGTAKKVVDAAKQAGVALTPAGATYPYGNDPDDANIRIAPTFPSIEDIEKAVTVLCVCAKLTAVIKLLEE